MKNSDNTSLDQNILFRYLHLHCFVHMYRVLTSIEPSGYFRKVRFPIFKRIERLFHNHEKHGLFKNLLFTFMSDLFVGIVITLIHASLNLMVPELIRQFMHFMKEKHLEERETGDFIQKFIIIQFLRLFFSEHSKRLFYQLAVKVESTLARKLISKSLRMAKESRYHIPQTEVIQLSNVDLKLVFNLFQSMNMFFEAPFIIVIAIIMLFNESSHYGFIGIYWFMIAFLLQRELDGRMTHCNQTKLGLIAKRSTLNYDLFDKIKEAKMIGWEDLLTQKNNDLFIEENHDHDLFYSYMTLYDISLLMLPIFVVSTITLYDMNEEDPITVQQVYVMLSLLEMCYIPMKSIRSISINLHDGLHSLERMAKYFHLSEEIKSTLIERNQGEVGQVTIQQGTIATYPFIHSKNDFDIHVNYPVCVQPGQRLCLLGKKRSGCSSFLEMLVGNLKKVRGKVYIRGKIAFMTEKMFFLKDTVEENIRFFNTKTTLKQIQEIYNAFGLNEDLKYQEEMETLMLDTNKFTKSVLKKIALSRMLLADADIYIFDSPFIDLSENYKNVLEDRLRQLQSRGKTIIMSFKQLQFAKGEDHIIILDEGHIDEYGTFNDLVNCIMESRIAMFIRSNQAGQDLLNAPNKSDSKFGESKLLSVRNRSDDMKSMISKRTFSKTRAIMNPSIMVRVAGLRAKQHRREMLAAKQNFEHLVMKFLTSVSVKQSIFIFLIILAAEVLHIFIHFYIGHLEEDYGNDDYNKYKNLMITEIILTFCLAGLIYLEGEFSTLLAIITGNKVYEESFNELAKKELSWHANEYNVQLADKYNHDYQEIFIACHSIYGIYKNLVIMIATIEFISSNRATLASIFLVLTSIYYLIFVIFRKVLFKIVKHYYDCKYNYVRVFEESIEGAEVIRVWGIKKDVMLRAEQKYETVASYKIAESYTSYALELVCDFLSISLLAIGLEYGIEMKMHHHEQSISIIATSIFLLMNMSEVLKNLISQILNFQSFFTINLIPFMEIGEHQQKVRTTVNPNAHKIPLVVPSHFVGHRLEFNNLILQEPGQSVKNNIILNLVIQEGETVLLYEKQNKARQLLMMGLTRNLPMFFDPEEFKPKSSNIKIGSVDIRSTSKEEWHRQIGVFANDNFYFNGTLRENISWKLQNFDEVEAASYAYMLDIGEHLQVVEKDVLSSHINITNKKVSQPLIRKIALLRILVRKPKIVLMQDTDEFIERLVVTDILRKELPGLTIVKINDHLETSFDVDRIVALENLELIEEGKPAELRARFSKLGEELKDVNFQNYKFLKQMSIGMTDQQKSTIFGKQSSITRQQPLIFNHLQSFHKPLRLH